MQDVIGEVLRAGLLESIGDDQTRVEYLRSAANKVATVLEADPLRIPEAVYVAVDERGHDQSIPLSWAKEALLEEWETFEIAFPSTPIELLRIVLLQAALKVAEKDWKKRGAVWYTLRNAIQVLSVGAWTTVTTRLVEHLTVQQGKVLHDEWNTAHDVPYVRMPAVPAQNINVDGLTQLGKGMAARFQDIVPAVQPNDARPLAAVVRDRIPEVLTGIINETRTAVVGAAKVEQAALADAVTAIGKKIREALEVQEKILGATARRVNLLWWRTALWSPSQEAAYRDLPGTAHVVTAAAWDLHSLTPPVAPLVVEHVLRDVVHTSILNREDDGEKIKFTDIAAAGSLIDSSRSREPSFPLLLDLVAGVELGNRKAQLPKEFRATRPASEWAIFIFRDLQARRLLSPTNE